MGFSIFLRSHSAYGVVIPAARFWRLLVWLSNGSPNIYFTPRAFYTFSMIFLFITPTREKCQADLQIFLRMCDFLWVPIAEEKIVVHSPSFNLRASLSIPWVKKPDCRTISFGKCKLVRRNVSLRELQSLLGLLIVTSSVVVPGRTFLRCMIDLTRRTKRPHHRIRLTKEAKCDIQVWLSFLQNFNSKTFFYTEQLDSHSHWFSERGWIREKILILRS